MTNDPDRNAESIQNVKTPLDLSERASCLKRLRLPTVRSTAVDLAEQAAIENLSHLEYLNELTLLECEARNDSRIQRRLKASELERSKTWDQIDWGRLPRPIRQKLELLRTGEYLR